MAKKPQSTPWQQAAYALTYDVPRSDLQPEVQRAYDEMVAGNPALAAKVGVSQETETGGRTPPETREKILRMIKNANPKYAKAFTGDRLAVVSLIGTESWAEYGQVVLQMAILDTLLSIEERLATLEMKDSTSG